MSGNIAFSLTYGQNPEKGGECFFSNYLDPTLSPAEQAADWEAMSNDYKNKVCQIIISFGEKDTRKFRQMENTAERVKLERQILAAFFRELAAKGNDISKTAYGVFHHGNTDNEHFHAYILMTDLEGKKWSDSFIKKNCTRAAAKVSIDFGLEGCPKAITRELAHQRHGGRIKRTLQDKRENSRKRKYNSTVDSEGHIHRDRGTSDDSTVINERMRRQHAAQMAKKRKRQFKYLTEKAAEGVSSPERIIANAMASGIRLFLDPRLGISMSAVDEEGKERRYALESDLEVNMSLFPEGVRLMLETDYVRAADKRKAEESKVKAAKVKKPVVAAPSKPEPPKRQARPGNVAGGIKQVLPNSGGSSSQNREYEVGNNRKSDDDLDEEWKHRNGMGY